MIIIVIVFMFGVISSVIGYYKKKPIFPCFWLGIIGGPIGWLVIFFNKWELIKGKGTEVDTLLPEDIQKINKILLLFNILFLMTVIIFLNNLILKFTNVYTDMNIRLPILTQIVLSKKCFVILTIILIAKEFLKNKSIVFVINALLTIVIGLVLPIVTFIGIFLPVFGITK